MNKESSDMAYQTLAAILHQEYKKFGMQISEVHDFNGAVKRLIEANADSIFSLVPQHPTESFESYATRLNLHIIQERLKIFKEVGT